MTTKLCVYVAFSQVLQDCLFEQQTFKIFDKVCRVKTEGTLNLDRISRERLQTSLDWFVVFSSAAAGYGNAGQSNYAFANSFMERVMEKRDKDSVPGMRE